MLEVNNVSAHYGQVQVLWDVSLKVNEAEICLLYTSDAADE